MATHNLSQGYVSQHVAADDASSAANGAPEAVSADDAPIRDWVLDLTTLSEVKELLMQSLVMLDDADEKLSQIERLNGRLNLSGPNTIEAVQDRIRKIMDKTCSARDEARKALLGQTKLLQAKQSAEQDSEAKAPEEQKKNKAEAEVKGAPASPGCQETQ